MKIAITATGTEQDASLDRRFGRCACFQVIDTETETTTTVDNSAIAAGGGAGIAAAQQLIDRKVNVLITGNLGPNAFETLNASGIEIYRASGGTVPGLIAQLKSGELEKQDLPM